MLSWKKEKLRLVESILNLDKLYLMSDDYVQELTKSADESKKCREEGNRLYTKDNHDENIHLETLRWYSRSVAFAPPDSEDLGLAYGNRSALLAHLKKYEEAVQDIERAIRLPIKPLNRIKYLTRKLECSIKLKLDEEAIDAYEEAELLIVKLEASEKVKGDLKDKLLKIMATLEEEMAKEAPVKTRSKYLLPPALTSRFFSHQSYEVPGASDALEINFTSKQGRHIVATRNIVPGEILYMAEPYACFPTEMKEHLNCSHCLRFAWTALPCRNCVHAVYCSEECRELAKKQYHDAECKVIFRVRHSLELLNSVRLMSVRMLIMALRETGGLDQLKESLEEVEACGDRRRRGFSNSQRIFADNHRSFFSLQSNVRKMVREDLEVVSEFSAVLVYMLGRYTTLFKKYFLDLDNRALAQNEQALYVGQLLSYFQHLIEANAIIVKDAYVTSHQDTDYEPPDENACAGVEVLPFLQLFNHSCNPNVVRCELDNRKVVLYAILPIAKGDQVFVSYGPSYYEYLKLERQKILERAYYFSCECEACANEWPHYIQMDAWDAMEYSVTSIDMMEQVARMVKRSEQLSNSLLEGKEDFDIDTLDEIIYTLMVVMKCTKIPNMQVASLITTLNTVFHMFFGYFVDMPATC